LRRVLIATFALLAVSALAVVAYGQGRLPGAEDCAWRSVDEREYVRANEAVLRSIPLPPHLRGAYATTWTHAVPASNKCLPFYENGPPYGAFMTTHVFVRRGGEPPIGFDRRVLGREWMLQFVAGNGMTFRKGPALLSVAISDDSVLLRVDHRAYAD
jgi:hypothetical protein